MLNFADRLQNLGTETAFAVSAEAAEYKARGHRVFPFHLGDINIRTPENVIEAAHRAMLDGYTGYCSNYGIPALRELLARDINTSHGTAYGVDNVVVQPGGKAEYRKLIMALMNPGEEVLYPNPGYPIYESQIEFHGGVAVPYGFNEGERNFEIRVDQIADSITPKTRILILNDLHNPSGAVAAGEELESIASLAIERDLFVCLTKLISISVTPVSRNPSFSFPGMEERSLILYTFSKKFAMTGWRLGASFGPKPLVDVLAKLNVNDESCSNHFIQHAAIEALTGDQSGHRQIVNTLQERRDEAVARLNEIDGIRCYLPDATFYLFPNVTEAMRGKGFEEYETFRRSVLEETGVAFCTRLHFGREVPGETDRYIRFAYSGIDTGDITEGLQLLKSYIEAR